MRSKSQMVRKSRRGGRKSHFQKRRPPKVMIHFTYQATKCRGLLGVQFQSEETLISHEKLPISMKIFSQLCFHNI
jgi:hypothetical protein